MRAGVCECRSALGSVDDGAEGGTPGLLAAGTLGPQTFVPFLIRKLMLPTYIFSSPMGTQQSDIPSEIVVATQDTYAVALVLAVGVAV